MSTKFFDNLLLKRLIQEGLRIGMTPWCCSQDYEYAAYRLLNTWPNCNKYPQETMEQTCQRRKNEKNIQNID